MGEIIAVIGCSLIIIFVMMSVLRAVIRLTWFLVGLITYFIIWLFAPKTWRDMHDA